MAEDEEGLTGNIHNRNHDETTQPKPGLGDRVKEGSTTTTINYHYNYHYHYGCGGEGDEGRVAGGRQGGSGGMLRRKCGCG